MRPLKKKQFPPSSNEVSVKCDDYDDDRGEACEVEEIDLTSHDHDIVLHLFFFK